jgi:hypothetical protein
MGPFGTIDPENGGHGQEIQILISSCRKLVIFDKTVG